MVGRLIFCGSLRVGAWAKQTEAKQQISARMSAEFLFITIKLELMRQNHCQNSWLNCLQSDGFLLTM